MNFINFLPHNLQTYLYLLHSSLFFLHPWANPSTRHWPQSSQVTPGPCYSLSSLYIQLLPLYLLLPLGLSTKYLLLLLKQSNRNIHDNQQTKPLPLTLPSCQGVVLAFSFPFTKFSENRLHVPSPETFIPPTL